MDLSKRAAMVLVLALAGISALGAQRPAGGAMGMMGSMPSMPRLQNPTVGAGAEYLVTAMGKEMDVASVTVGKEDVDGAKGIWMEQRMTGGATGGEMVMKSLIVTTAGESGVKRMIMQLRGQPPMEMSSTIMSLMQQHPSTSTQSMASGSGKGGMGELVGADSITVPAGTFSCQHYRKQEPHGPVDMWISTEVSPYAMVKMTGPNVSMVLKKVLTNEASHIKGEPQKMQMPQF